MNERSSEREHRFDVLFAAHSRDIVAYCGWRAASPTDAQDAVAEVFLTAWRRLDDVPDGHDTRVWLYATARRVIANQRRSNRRRNALHERLAVEPDAPAPEKTDPDESLVHDVLARLGPRDREVLLLSEWEGLTPAQIGVVLGCLTVTARGRLHRARQVSCPIRRASGRRRSSVARRGEPTRPRAASRCSPHVREGGIVNTTDSYMALRRANPRLHPEFTASVEAAGEVVRTRIAAADDSTPRRRRRLGRLSTSGVAVAAAVAAVVAIGDFGGGAGVESATAAFRQAATLTAATAERSGTVDVRITHNGEEWAGSVIRWNGNDISIARRQPSSFRKVGDEMRVVDGTLYGLDHTGGWVALGSPRNIDPDSGTTPDEYLVAVREDVGGVTLQQFTTNMRELTRTSFDDGSAVYRGTVAAGLIAPETGVKEGQAIRVFPFGYVAHDEAANPDSRLDVVVAVGPEGVVRKITVTWGAPPSSWVYTVAYSVLGATRAPVVPPNAKSLAELRGLPKPAAPATP